MLADLLPNRSGRALMRRAFVSAAVAALVGLAPILGGAHSALAQTKYPLGAVPSTPQAFTKASRFVIRAKRGGDRPASVLLTQFLPPVGNQGNQNSCVGWSTAYYAYSYAVAQKRLLTDQDRADAKFQFSPAYIYHLGNGGNDKGMAISNAMNILKARGCCTLAEMPYNVTDFLSQPTDMANKRAARYVAVDVASITQGPGDAAEKMKTFLADMQSALFQA